jgi:nucleoid-associated protein EbfC
VNPLKMQEMLEQARNMQTQMQEKLSQTVVEASSGGGAVSVKMNGQKQVLQLKIDAAAVMSLSSSPSDVEMLEDLIVAAFNEAGRRADESIKSNLSGMLGGLNLPPGLF